MTNLHEDFPFALEYLNSIENIINEKIKSLNTVENLTIPITLPTDIQIDDFIIELKKKQLSERNTFINQFMINNNLNINESNDKYYTFSESTKSAQLKKLHKKLEKISKIKSNPQKLFNINNNFKNKKNISNTA